MKLQLSKLAASDAEEAVLYYLSAAGPAIAVQFEAALEGALRHVRDYPFSGSPRVAIETGIEGVRVWPVRGFPYLVFYDASDDRCRVWRILSAAMDVPPRLRAAANPDELTAS